VTALELAGVEPYLDRYDIAAAEDWEVRLGELIQSAGPLSVATASPVLFSGVESIFLPALREAARRVAAL
jgi:hypothetical protein